MWNILLEVLNLNFKPFEELEFSDDFMFGKIMQNPEICGGVIERLLHIKVNRIEFPKLQNTIKPYYTSKGVRFDVYLKDSDRVFDIEIQTTTPVALGKRMRYYQSIIDMDSTMKGDDYSELKESYIIFICKTSPFQNFDLPVYTFKNTCVEDSSVSLDDKTLKAIYNSSAYEKESDPELKAFLNFVCSNKAEDDFTEQIQILVNQAKLMEANKTEYMNINIHEMDIRREGKIEAKIEDATKMLLKNYPVSDICEITGLTEDKIFELKEKLSVTIS